MALIVIVVSETEFYFTEPNFTQLPEAPSTEIVKKKLK